MRQDSKCSDQNVIYANAANSVFKLNFSSNLIPKEQICQEKPQANNIACPDGVNNFCVNEG